MAYPWGTREEILKRAQCWKANSPLILNSNGADNVNTGFAMPVYRCLQNAYPNGWFAPYDLVILKATLSASGEQFIGADSFGIFGWSFNEAAFTNGAGIPSFPPNSVGNPYMIASIALAGPLSALFPLSPGYFNLSQEFNFDACPIFVEKGQEIILGLDTFNTITLAWTANLYYLPTFA